MSKAMEFADQGDQKADLTPMIDMVFQLIIFFVVVSDFSSTQLEPVVLPLAVKADTEPEKEKDRSIIVNVLPDGAIRINRHTFGGPDPQNPGQDLPYKILKDHFQVEAELAGMEDNPDTPGQKVSKLRVIIRADANAQYKYVQMVFKACAENKVFKTVINATKDPLKPVQ